MKTTLVIGASTNPERYSFLAIRKLIQHQYNVKALGNRPGVIDGISIDTSPFQYENIDTITLYVNPKNQMPFYDYIISLKPRRVIFNPNTENQAFMSLLAQNDIEAIAACTLVLLATGRY